MRGDLLVTGIFGLALIGALILRKSIDKSADEIADWSDTAIPFFPAGASPFAGTVSANVSSADCGPLASGLLSGRERSAHIESDGYETVYPDLSDAPLFHASGDTREEQA